jgi:nucleotide-binding universal stress UspA family protein
MLQDTAPLASGGAGAGRHALFQDLLVYQDETPAAANALDYAEGIAQAAHGNVAGLMFGFMALYPMTMYMEASPDVWLAAQRRADAEATATQDRLKLRFQRSPVGAELRRVDIMEGEAGRTLAIHGRYVDAIVLGWSGDGGSDLQHRLFEGVLFNSGRGVIIVPEAHRQAGPPGRVLIGWSAERESARALQQAMPLLKAADAVRVVVVDKHGATLHGEDAGADIARHLARHDVRVDVKHVPSAGQNVGQVILDEARYFGTDLLVLGGYGHSRMSEWILGGVTRHVLSRATIPVLFAH